MGFTKERLEKKCIICGKDFVAYHKKGLLCGHWRCKKEHENNRKKTSALLTFQYAFESNLLMQKLDYIIQVMELITGIPTPHKFIPAQNKVDLSHYDPELIRRFELEKKRIGGKIESINKKIQKKPRAIPQITKEILEERELLAKERKININEEELKGTLKKIATDTIKNNTGKFPILTPQEVTKLGLVIEKIKWILIKKDDKDIGNKDIVDYFTEAISDITQMPNEKYFIG